MLDLAQPSHSLRKLRRSRSSHTTVVKATQESFTGRDGGEEGERSIKKEGRKEKQGGRPSSELASASFRFIPHYSRVLSSLAEMDYALQKKGIITLLL